MISRRALLQTVGGGFTAGLVSGLAGCSGSEDYPEGVDPDEAVEHFDEALTALVENDETLSDWAQGRPGREQQDIDRLRTNLEQARDSLDAAEDVAPEDMMDQIDYVRDIATFQEALTDYYEVTVEFDNTRTDAAAFGDSEQHERAVEQYEAAKDLLDDARSELDSIEAAHEPIASTSFDDIDLDYRGEPTQYVEVEGEGSIDAQELLIDGQLNIHQMFVELNDGFERYENGEFEAARERFTAGDEARQRAVDAFEAVQDHEFAWASLREESIGYLAIVEDIAEAFELFIDATNEAEAGNPQEANELAEEGFFVLDQAFQ